MDISLFSVTLLIGTGFAAGIINTLAGGGSNLTLPALMVMGMPPEVANATNRVGIFLQCLTGAAGFKKHDKMPLQDISHIMLPTLTGALFGAATASYAPSWVLKPMLLSAMLIMAFIMLIKPGIMTPDPDTIPNKVADTPSSWLSLGVAGFYGGFVHAGVGFILLAALAGTLRYDLVRANALKLLVSMAFTGVALVIFILRDQVLWVPGLILSVGFIAGAQLAVKLAIKASPEAMKKFLFVMTLAGCIAAAYS